MFILSIIAIILSTLTLIRSVFLQMKIKDLDKSIGLLNKNDVYLLDRLPAQHYKLPFAKIEDDKWIPPNIG